MSEEFVTYGQQQIKGCIFCSDDIRNRIIASNGTVFAIEDQYPVTESHILVIPYRHTSDFFSMTSQEKQHAEELLSTLKTKIINKDTTVTGFNVGMNCGESAGQTVMHAHIHMIPRRKGDVENPRGGIRHVIAGKGYY